MSVIIKTKPVQPVVEPIEEIVVRPTRIGSNQLVVGVENEVRRTSGHEFRTIRRVGEAHLLFTVGQGLYLNARDLRSLGESLVLAADQIEEASR